MLRHGGGSGGHVTQLQWIPQRGVAPHKLGCGRPQCAPPLNLALTHSKPVHGEQNVF